MLLGGRAASGREEAGVGDVGVGVAVCDEETADPTESADAGEGLIALAEGGPALVGVDKGDEVEGARLRVLRVRGERVGVKGRAPSGKAFVEMESGEGAGEVVFWYGEVGVRGVTGPSLCSRGSIGWDELRWKGLEACTEAREGE